MTLGLRWTDKAELAERKNERRSPEAEKENALLMSYSPFVSGKKLKSQTAETLATISTPFFLSTTEFKFRRGL